MNADGRTSYELLMVDGVGHGKALRAGTREKRTSWLLGG